MGSLAIVLLRVVIALSFAGSLFVQFWMMPIIWNDLSDIPDWLRLTVVVLLILEVVALQVVAVCIWQLLTLVRRGHGLLGCRLPVRRRGHRSHHGGIAVTLSSR